MEKVEVISRFRSYCPVNTALLPMKLVFFFSFGGFAGVLPFMPLIAKQLGITATAVGLAYSTIPIFIFLSNPIVGFFVDYFQNVKVFLMVLLISSCVAYTSVLSLPPITHATEDATYLQIFQYNNSENLINISTPLQKSCMREILKEEIHCKLDLKYANLFSFNDSYSDIHRPGSIKITHNAGDLDTVNKLHNIWLSFYVQDISLFETRDLIVDLKSLRCSPNIQHCSISTDTTSVYSTYQFWAFSTFVIIGGIAWISAMTLCSVACLELLGLQVELYGRQRLFGTISSGSITSLAGILNDISTVKSFIPGFCLMAVFITIAVIILYIIYIPKAHISTSISADIATIFKSKEILVFSLGVALVGFLASILMMYEFWFLEDMGANQTLLGLSVAVQCLLSEVPLLFLSGWFVKKFGHFLCLVISFTGFVIRFMLLTIIKDPWLSLPIGLLNGVTYGIYHGAMASFAKEKSPKGMEATLLGFFGGLYDGLAYGIGSVLGGLGIDNLGARWTFFASSMISLVCLFLFSVASYVFRTSNTREIPKVSSVEIKEASRDS